MEGDEVWQSRRVAYAAAHCLVWLKEKVDQVFPCSAALFICLVAVLCGKDTH